jgi:hypothetical protein
MPEVTIGATEGGAEGSDPGIATGPGGAGSAATGPGRAGSVPTGASIAGAVSAEPFAESFNRYRRSCWLVVDVST